MNTLNKALIVVLLLQVGLAAYTLTRDDTTTIARPAPLFDGFDAATVERVEIWNDTSTEDKKPAIVLAKHNDAWVLSSHFDYPVETSKVDGLLKRVKDVESRGPMVTNKERQAQLKVAEDDYSRKLIVHRAGGTDPLTAYIGSLASTGKTAVRLHGETDIHGVFGLAPANVPASLRDWLEMKWFTVTSSEIDRLTIHNGAGEFVFDRDPASQWKLATPAGTPPDGAAPTAPPEGKEFDAGSIETMVSAVSDIELVEPADPASKPTPLATVILRLKPATPPPGPDGQTPAISTMPEQHTLEIGPGSSDARYIVTRADHAYPIEVDASTFKSIVELTQEKLYKDKAPENPEPETVPMPPGAMPGGGAFAPPGF